nr:MAG TPA: hypothetical protein [Caudoviricetes sp.]
MRHTPVDRATPCGVMVSATRLFHHRPLGRLD